MSYVRRSRFVFGTSDWTTELSARPWTPADFTIGGSRTSAAGIAASYIVRRDALTRLPLRVSEDEWVNLLALVKYGQTSQSFTWYPDADFTDAIQVVLESPLAGESWEPSRMGEFLRVFEFTLTLRAVPSLTPSVDPYREYFADPGEAITDTVIDSVPVLPTSIPALAVGSTQLLQGQALNLSLQTLPGVVVTWFSDDPTVATVGPDITSDGLIHYATVTGISVGSTTVRAFANGVPASAVTTTITAAPSGTLYWSDDQATGGFGPGSGGYAWSNFDGGYWNPDPVVVADADSPTGYAVRFRYTGSSPGGSLSEARIVFGDNLTEVYLGWSIKFPLNYFHRNGPSSDNNKMLRVWGNAYSSSEGDGDVGIKTGFSALPHSDGSSFFNFNHETIGRTLGDGGLLAEWHPTGVTGIRLGTDLGAYHRYVYHAKASSAPGASDGVVELFIDGVAVWSKSDAPLEDQSPVPHAYFDQMYLLGAANCGFNVTTDIMLQGVKIGATYSDVA